MNTCKFILREAILYVAQIFIGFFVIFFLTHIFCDEEIVTSVINSKITPNILKELGYTILSITLALGVISLLQKITDNKFTDIILNEVMLEMPRAIYFFGSQMTSAIISLAIAVNLYPSSIKSKEILFMAFVISFATFLYGCGLKYLLKRKELSK